MMKETNFYILKKETSIISLNNLIESSQLRNSSALWVPVWEWCITDRTTWTLL